MFDFLVFILLLAPQLVPRHEGPVLVRYPDNTLTFPLPEGMCNISYTWDARNILEDINRIADQNNLTFNTYYLYIPCTAVGYSTFFGIWGDFGLLSVHEEIPLRDQLSGQIEFNEQFLEIAKTEETKDLVDERIEMVLTDEEISESPFWFNFDRSKGITPVYFDEGVMVVHRINSGTVGFSGFQDTYFDENILGATTFLGRLPILYEFYSSSFDDTYLNEIVRKLKLNSRVLLELNAHLLTNR